MTAPHTMRAGAGLRILRAAVFTAVCVVLSAVGHALASCATVPWWSLCAGFLAVFAVAAPLAGRRRTLPGLAGALAVGQLGLHTLFGLGQHGAAVAASSSLSGGGAAGASARAASDSSLAALAARLICGGNSVPLSPADARQVLERAGLNPDSLTAPAHNAHAHMAQAAAEPSAGLFSLSMLLGHLLAALAAGWLLSRGDAALFRLVALSRLSTPAAPVRALRSALALVRALVAGLPGTPGRTPRAPRSTPDRAVAPGRAALQHSVIRRGPPVALALAA
ncbi:hypothetical protein ABT084_04400 [Streptomyces sp. NPDC002138]|uniref:hypothetical protein n=1 Tax=Streptomyces sp. NPDC002138 TaxID=3154410 RepID=UPI003329C3F6